MQAFLDVLGDPVQPDIACVVCTLVFKDEEDLRINLCLAS